MQPDPPRWAVVLYGLAVAPPLVTTAVVFAALLRSAGAPDAVVPAAALLFGLVLTVAAASQADRVLCWVRHGWVRLGGPVQPLQSHPALWAWFGRLVGYWLVGLLAVALPGRAALDRWLPHDSMPPLLVAAAYIAAGLVFVVVGNYVIQTLLHDRFEAAWREFEAQGGKLRRRRGGRDAA